MATERKGEILPNPDPSIITTEMIDKAISNLESRLDAKLHGMEKAVEVFHADLTRVPTLLDRQIISLREIIETRLVCQENDVKGIHTYLDTRGKDISEQIMHLRELMISKVELAIEKTQNFSEVAGEKFNGIEKQFAERDKRTEQLSLADKTAIAAALQAQKEAAGAQNESNSTANTKMETNFVKLIDQGNALLLEVRRNTEAQINDLKASRDKGEGSTRGSDRTTDRTSTVMTLAIAGLVALVVVVGAIAAVVMATRPPAPIYLPAPPNAVVR